MLVVTLETNKAEFGYNQPLPIVLTQRIVVLDRAIEHGVISIERFDALVIMYRGENRAELESRANRRIQRKVPILRFKSGQEIKFVSRDGKIGEFTMERFEGLRSLFGACMMFIVGVWIRELRCACRSLPFVLFCATLGIVFYLRPSPRPLIPPRISHEAALREIDELFRASMERNISSISHG